MENEKIGVEVSASLANGEYGFIFRTMDIP